MLVVAALLVAAVLGVGLLFLRLHTLPERIAHQGHKLQFEIVAVLGLLALLTHVHIFWVAGLLLALIDIPDFLSPLRRIADATERVAGMSASDPTPTKGVEAAPPLSPNEPVGLPSEEHETPIVSADVDISSQEKSNA